MRRKDREIIDNDKIQDIIDRCICCRVGFYDKGEIYIVPLNFGYEKNDNSYTFYFHGAKDGRKIALIKEKPMAGFEMDTNYKLLESQRVCGYSSRFQSIIGNGKISIVSEFEQKRKALELIMFHNTKKDGWKFEDNSINSTSVFKLEVINMSCKEHE